MKYTIATNVDHSHQQVDQFLLQLINYDKENIHENCLKAIKPYLDSPEFETEFVRGKVSVTS